MSGVAVIRYLLANNAAVIALAPAARIVAGDVPLKMQLPAIGVKQVSGVERLTVAMTEASRHRTDRVQVTVYAGTYPSKKALIELVRDACANQSGTVNSVALDSILPDGIGPDFDDEEAKVYEQSIDLIVRWGAT